MCGTIWQEYWQCIGLIVLATQTWLDCFPCDGLPKNLYSQNLSGVFLAQCKHTVCEIRKQSWHRIWYIANNNLSTEYRRMVKVRIFDFISEYKRKLCLNSASKP